METPIQRSSVSQQVVDYVLDCIDRGELKQGDRLPGEREFAERLGISRVPLREAISALSALGIVEKRHGDGNYIAGFSPAILGRILHTYTVLDYSLAGDLFEARSVVEGAAARLAARNARTEDIAALRQDVDRMEADIPAYNALVLDSDRNRWWGYDDVGGLGAPVTERSFYDVARRDFENRMAVNFAVRLNGTLIGEAVLYNFDYRGSAELGCRIDKAYAGNGYGTEAFRCAAEWGLYQANLSRIVAKCYKENEASYKMLSACMRRNGEDETFFYFEKLV